MSSIFIFCYKTYNITKIVILQWQMFLLHLLMCQYKHGHISGCLLYELI